MTPQCIDDFANTLLSDTTRRAYASDLRAFAAWLGEDFAPNGLTPGDVQRYKQTLIKAGRAPATINRALVSLSRFAKWCLSAGVAPRNFAEGVKPVATVRPGPQALTAVERDRLIRAAAKADNARDVALLTLMARTGLRIGETCGLTRDDVQISERKGEVLVRAGKGEKYRVVPLVKEVRWTLQQYLDTRHDDAPALFLGQRGPLTDGGAYEVVRKYAAIAKVKCHPHTLRHTMATLYLQDNPDDLVGLARLLGHDSLNTTMRYTLPTTDVLAARMEAVR